MSYPRMKCDPWMSNMHQTCGLYRLEHGTIYIYSISPCYVPKAMFCILMFEKQNSE